MYICLNNPIHQGKLLEANVDRQWLQENLQNILRYAEVFGQNEMKQNSSVSNKVCLTFSGSAVSGLGGVLGAKTGLASALVGVVEPDPNKGTASLLGSRRRFQRSLRSDR